MDNLRVLALSGSLREASFNTAALQAAAILAPNGVAISMISLGDLPLFNPDREEDVIGSVVALKAALKNCEGLLIASPEYAHGVTGVLKNALDWLVSGNEFVDKPIMLINTSPRASHAQESLKEILITMSGKLVDDAHVTIPLLGSQLDVHGIVEHREISKMLTTGLVVFRDAISMSSNEIMA